MKKEEVQLRELLQHRALNYIQRYYDDTTLERLAHTILIASIEDHPFVL